MNTSRLMFRKSPGYFGRIQAFRFATSSTAEKPEGDQKKKRLDVAIVGAPNAGKSQLINVLTQSKIAAVSRKRHTTRSDVLGARTVDNTTQIVFKDTPGFLRLEDAKEERLDRDLIVTAATELQHVDYSLLVVDAARKLTESYRHALVQLMVGALNSRGRMEEVDFEDKEESTSKKNEEYSMQEETSKFAIILNKVDLVNPKKKLLDMAMEIGELADACLIDQYSDKDGSRNLDFDKLLKISPLVFYVSALEEEGVDEILDHLVSNATPCRSWAVESGQSTNMTKYEHAQELIREKIYRCLHQELPHSVQQVNRMFRKVESGMIVHQDLVVFTKSHQKLVLGSGGRTLKRIQDSAERDLEDLFRCDVSLRLHVKLNKSKQRRNVVEDYQ